MKKVGKRWPVVLSSGLALLLSCSSAAPAIIGLPGSYQKDAGLYEDPEVGLSLYVPPKWELRKGERTYLVAISPFDNPQDNFRDNFNLAFYNAPGTASTDVFYALNRNQLPRMVRGMRTRAEESLSGQLNWKTISIDYDVNENVRLTTLFAFCVEGNRALLFTGTATEPEYGRFEGDFKKAIESLHFSK